MSRSGLNTGANYRHFIVACSVVIEVRVQMIWGVGEGGQGTCPVVAYANDRTVHAFALGQLQSLPVLTIAIAQSEQQQKSKTQRTLRARAATAELFSANDTRSKNMD